MLRNGRHLTHVGLLLILVWGSLIRLADLPHWMADAAHMQFQGKPLLASVDGYYFLDLARRDAAGPVTSQLHPDDPASRIPAHVDPAPKRLPLPAQLVGALAALLHLDLLWIAAWLPPLLAPLVAIPLFFLGRVWGGRVGGLTAAWFGVMAPLFVQRSAFAGFDTDMLIPPLLLLTSLGFLNFARHKPGEGYISLLTALGGHGLFLWWWDRAPAQILGMHLFFMLVSWAFFRPPKGKDGLALALFLLFTCATFYLARGEFPSLDLFATLRHGLAFFVGQERSALPPVAPLIEEFHTISWSQAATGALGHPVVVVAGLAGLLLLARQARKEMLFLFPLGLLGLWGLFGAMRLLIFTGPLLALGMGQLTATIRASIDRWRPGASRWLLLPALAATSLPVLVSALPHQPALAVPAKLASGMAAIDSHVPPQAWIWSLWDAGHPLRYWSQRPVVFDGHVDVAEAGERLVYNTLPLATADAVFAARFMRFYSATGLPGMRRYQQEAGGDGELAIKQVRARLTHTPPPSASPEAILAPPVYLFLSRDMLDKAPWWYPFATWNFAQRRGNKPFIVRLTGFSQADHIVHFATAEPTRSLPKGPLRVDLDKGLFLAGDQVSPLVQAGLFDASGQPRRHDFNHPHGLTLLLDIPHAVGYLMDQGLAHSVLVRLWFFQDPPPGTFRLVHHSGLDYQIWEVVGDKKNP
ncbi:MAG: hypothetical protein HQL63_13405 [Magnetococcales bacterium]|nr:hypothetical protein [Magnetococcales bacterium]